MNVFKTERDDEKKISLRKKQKVFIIWESFKEYANDWLLLTVNITATANTEQFNGNEFCKVTNKLYFNLLSHTLIRPNIWIFTHIYQMSN